MTKYTYRFFDINNNITVITKEFNSYMKAMNFGAEYMGTHFDIVRYTMI